MPRLDLRPPPARGPLTPQERRIVEVMLAMLNDLREALGLPPRTMAEAEAMVRAQDERETR
jgi:hypothetical protein